MKIVSWNVNGIRASYKQGFSKIFSNLDPDIVCLQEIRAKKEQFPEKIRDLHNYFIYFNSASKKGYAGVAIYSKIKPTSIKDKLGYKRADEEGRFLQLNFSSFILINIYVPHGGRKKENLKHKLAFYNHLIKYLDTIKNKKVIVCGDFNIAHEEIDLARPKNNKDNVMFTKEERKQLDKLLKTGFIDIFRLIYPKKQIYTWWPYYRKARESNIGWRIDYFFISKKLFSKKATPLILNKILGSDHCPISLVLK